MPRVAVGDRGGGGFVLGVCVAKGVGSTVDGVFEVVSGLLVGVEVMVTGETPGPGKVGECKRHPDKGLSNNPINANAHRVEKPF